jgi:hypothetical protein
VMFRTNVPAAPVKSPKMKTIHSRIEVPPRLLLYVICSSNKKQANWAFGSGLGGYVRGNMAPSTQQRLKSLGTGADGLTTRGPAYSRFGEKMPWELGVVSRGVWLKASAYASQPAAGGALSRNGCTFSQQASSTVTSPSRGCHWQLVCQCKIARRHHWRASRQWHPFGIALCKWPLLTLPTPSRAGRSRGTAAPFPSRLPAR